ncbi:MAG: RNA pseudouridine synthase, partial [Sandarakinorhabdus sp.]|nr:RNA pseudouridine synthase [Sandarakinorhabdus sp.]
MPTITIADDDDGIRLDRWFQRHVPDTSFNIVSRWARTGQIRLNGAKAAPGDRIAAGQALLYPDVVPESAVPRPVARERDELSPAQVEYIQSLVIHMDKHAIVINKPPGLATQGGIGITT